MLPDASPPTKRLQRVAQVVDAAVVDRSHVRQRGCGIVEARGRDEQGQCGHGFLESDPASCRCFLRPRCAEPATPTSLLRTLAARRVPGGDCVATGRANGIGSEERQMKVLVLGTGVIGVTAAYELAGAGHEVIVIDRQDGPGLETSFANAGEVSPGYSAPWAGPGVPLKAIKWLPMHHRPLVIRPALDCSADPLGAGDAAQLHDSALRDQQGRMVRLAEYSRDCLRDLRAQTGIGYDERMQGTLQLFRTQKQFDGSAVDIAVLERYGVDLRAARPRRLHPPRAGARACARQVRRRPAPARRRDRRLLQVHAHAGHAGRAARRRVSLRTSIDAVAPRRRPPDRRRDAARARSAPTPTWSRSAATRRCCSSRSASTSRSIRSRATRSRCRSPMPPARPNRP